MKNNIFDISPYNPFTNFTHNLILQIDSCLPMNKYQTFEYHSMNNKSKPKDLAFNINSVKQSMMAGMPINNKKDQNKDIPILDNDNKYNIFNSLAEKQ